jgi:hypothetical protein
VVSSRDNNLSLSDLRLARRFFVASVELSTREEDERILSVLHSYIIASNPSIISLSLPSSAASAIAPNGSKQDRSNGVDGVEREGSGSSDGTTPTGRESPLGSVCRDVFDGVPLHLQESVHQAFGFADIPSGVPA